MKRPPIERCMHVLSQVIRENRLNPRWDSLGKLMRALESRRDCDDVIAWLAEACSRHDYLTRSAFIGPALECAGLPALATVCDQAHAAWSSRKFKKVNGYNQHESNSKRRNRSRKRKRPARRAR